MNQKEKQRTRDMTWKRKAKNSGRHEMGRKAKRGGGGRETERKANE